MSDSNVPLQPSHMTGMKYVLNKSISFPQEHFSILQGDDTGGVLASMLKNC
jgi:hypothetical protein